MGERDGSIRIVPWPVFVSELAGTALLLLVGLSLVVLMFGDGSPITGVLPSEGWRRWIDTSLPSPQDIVEWDKAPSAPGRTYRAGPRSVVVLYAVAGRDDQNPAVAGPTW